MNNLWKSKIIHDDRGILNFIELSSHNFNCKRVYWIKNVPKNKSRGFHAHFTIEQIAICISGSFEILLDTGQKEKNFFINTGNGVFIPKMTWHVLQKFSSDCVLIVLANDCYFEKDYIRDYQKFISLAKK